MGLSIVLLGVIMMLFAFALQMLLAIWLFLPLAIIYIGMSFLFANSSTLAMQTAQDKSSASAMMNFINMGIATLCVLFISLIPMKSVLLLPFAYGILTLISFLLALNLV